ncbi:putative alpha and gamma adaptin-binding protein p34 [Elsinoe fawcettii]|nr:putative alpha and gamma adaptin-binding protein p34 [Elsinoe fawcettii]
MKIEHPRRLLIVGRSGCDLSGLVESLTGSRPTVNSDGSIAGSIHEWHLKTNYYSAHIPLWIDQIGDLERWQEEFSAPDAREVIQALGGWIYCFNKPTQTTDDAISQMRDEAQAGMKAIEAIISKACGYGWEGVKLAVALSPPGSKAAASSLVHEEWEDLCIDHGFEFIDAAATGKNDFGEAQGLDRIRETVETNDWSAAFVDDEDGEAPVGTFDDEQAQMNAELWGLKASLLAEDNEDDDTARENLEVENLEGLLQHAMAIREEGAAMPLDQRRRFAAKAIDDLMKNV